MKQYDDSGLPCVRRRSLSTTSTDDDDSKGRRSKVHIVKKMWAAPRIPNRPNIPPTSTCGACCSASTSTSPHAHCKVTSIDTAAAEKMAGVKSVHVMAPAGTEVNWQGFEIAAVAATTEEIAREGPQDRIDLEVLPHFVKDSDLAKAGSRAVRAASR